MTQTHIKQTIHKHQTNFFEELVPSVLPLLKKKKKVHKARTRWYRGPSRRFINTRFLKSIKKGMDRSTLATTNQKLSA